MNNPLHLYQKGEGKCLYLRFVLNLLIKPIRLKKPVLAPAQKSEQTGASCCLTWATATTAKKRNALQLKAKAA